MIRYDKKFNAEIVSAVRRYNAKIKYYEKLGVYTLPEKTKVSEIKKDVRSRQEIRKKLRDLEKLKTDFNKIYETKYPNGAHTYIYQDFKAVLNKENKGLVGYAVYVKLYASEANLSIDKSTAENLIAEYYLKSDGSREYIQNPYNIN